MGARLDLAKPIQAEATAGEHRARWESAARRERWLWGRMDKCLSCSEWVGHFGGSIDRVPCELLPLNVPLEEVRPNCFTVRRYWFGDSIRAVCKN